MAKFILQAVKREGFEHVWRGGRAWPATPTEVEVLEEQEECPTITVTESGRPDRVALHPRQIGQKNWRSIMADGRISKTPAGLEAAAATVSRMGTELAERDAQIERLAARADRLAAEARDRLDQAADELAKREARIDELEAEVAALKAAAEIAAKGKPVEGPAKPAEEPPADKGGKKK